MNERHSQNLSINNKKLQILIRGGSNIRKIPTKLKIMAQDSSGKKFNRIPEHKRKVGGKTITVKEHIRSNRKDSKGKK